MIVISQEKSQKIISSSGESLFVQFSYDSEIVKKIKSLPERQYIPKSKKWEVPLKDIKKIIGLFKPDEITIKDNIDLNYKELEKQFLNNNDRIDLFKEELSWINNSELKDFCEKALMLLPEYFFHVAASSTGKYHPKYALGEGGLVRHTKAAMKIAHELFNNHSIQDFDEITQDIILVALCLHDGVKHGINGSKFTVVEHPLEVTNYLEEKFHDIKQEKYWELIKSGIQSHMGEWNKNRSKKEVLPKPKTKMQIFIHMCDYLASRKCIEVIL